MPSPRWRPLKNSAEIASLYRNYLRQARRLPHAYLRHFFELKARDDLESIVDCRLPRIHNGRFDRAVKEQKKLKAANQGHVAAFQHVLDLAYGRKGKLKWELLEPIRQDATIPEHPIIIPQDPNSYPPAYSTATTSLLMTAQAKKTRKPLKKDAWSRSALLPVRADPESDEARLLGPFSKRREYNIQWRFFKKQVGTLWAPLGVSSPAESITAEEPPLSSSGSSERRTPSGVISDFGLVQEAEALVGASSPPPLTRKERAQGLVQPTHETQRHPSLWVRRRYREMLARLPLVTSRPPSTQERPSTCSTTFSPYALGSPTPTMREVDPATLAWIEQDVAQKAAAKQKKGNPNKRAPGGEQQAQSGKV